MTSRNTLLGRAPWVNGVKTGHTLGAGYVLVGSGTRGSTTLISAVLGTPSEDARDQTRSSCSTTASRSTTRSSR